MFLSMGFSCLRTLLMGVYTPVYVCLQSCGDYSIRHGNLWPANDQAVYQVSQTYKWYCANALILCLQWFPADYIAIFRSCTSVWQGGFSVRDATLVNTLESVACWKSYDDLGVSFLDCPPSYILDLQETYARTFFYIVSTVFVTVTLAILAIANGTLCSSSMTINCARV
ncbi:hypothetical protein J3Q64DRAFT_1698399 [Phycomyces blakesleeanus]|uniref:Uncharacterized protein n=2 Tax=Phycomyces blakesleeanus TaxID=4837 RepID=A0A162UCD6_PHYB8|nr:hypothetical protein PHYBLDRAFT_166460 [Phycomyces blakesleeanus NRRL 1555(-)]OAD75192.1 hypothetical protein PHYBLDRAFT_166460 [Phycomyces blakesleeanus NRRL 1555(-)]|eukprot:XP_018293232.1 hypothetical protein PHYBLDRAFT_166460 [Phycomyces blakesleeanus NRRL 1555(-)]